MKLTDCLINKLPQVGDIVVSYRLDVGMVMTQPTSSTDDNCIMVWDIKKQSIKYWYVEQIFPIKEECIDYLANFTFSRRDRIYQIVVSQENIDYDFDRHKFQIFNEQLEIIDDFYDNKFTRLVHSFVFADKVKKVIKKEKNNGNRVIELTNGEIWRVHRVKNKSSLLSKKIRKQYKENNYIKNHSTHYELIEKLN